MVPDLIAWAIGRKMTELTEMPMGFRDLLWCPILNEPGILSYENDKPICPHCTSFSIETHTFIGHITKPRFQ